MGLKKGQTGNKNGRPKGIPNKVTASLREKLKVVLEAELENLPGLLDDLEPDKRLRVFIDLLQYALPKATEQVESSQITTSGSFLELLKREYSIKSESQIKIANLYENNNLRENS